MNDKNWIKFRMIAWSIVAILLAVVLAIGIKGWGGSTFSGNILKTDFNTSNLVITENDEENIKVIVKSNKKLKNKKYINAEVRSQTLNIGDFNNKSSRNIFGIFNGYYLEVEMKIPKSYKENITINNRVGDITFNSDLNLNKLDINIKTGDIDGNQKINSKKITIDSKVC